MNTNEIIVCMCAYVGDDMDNVLGAYGVYIFKQQVRGSQPCIIILINLNILQVNMIIFNVVLTQSTKIKSS